MNLILNIAYKYLINRRRQTIVAVIGIAVGVSFFISLTAMLKGMQQFFVDKVIDISPHVTIKDEYRNPKTQAIFEKYPDKIVVLNNLKPDNEIKGIRNYKMINEYLDSEPDIKYVNSLQSQAFLRYGSKEVGALAIGINPKEEKTVSNLERDMIVGSLSELESSVNAVIVGKLLAKKLGVSYKDKIKITSSKGVSLLVKVVGIFQTGITSVDSGQAYLLLKKVQILEQKNNRINLIRLKLKDINTARETAKKIESQFGYKTEGWEESNSNVFSIFKVQNGVIYSTIFAIIIVASFGIYNIVSNMVNEKTRDVAILKSIGFSESDIKKIFVYQGLIMGAFGGIIGCILGFIIMEGLSVINFRIEEGSFMTMDGFILYRSNYLYLAAWVSAIIISALSSWMPASRASSTVPVNIIRGAV